MSPHDHGSGDSARATEGSVRRLGAVAAINLGGFVLELAGGLAFGSVALVGDALHMLFDALAYVVALVATLVARRSSPAGRWSYGLHRIEPFAAFLNGILLVPMVLFLVSEAYERFRSPVEVDAAMTLVLATGGLVINVASVYVLQGGEMSLNERGAYYHLVGDAGASVAVIVSMLVVLATDLLLVDPLTAVLIAGFIVWSAVTLLRESGAIFFQRSPIDPDAVRAAVAAIDGVERVDDLHVWSLSSRVSVASVAVTDAATTVAERDALVERIHEALRSEFDVSHATVEATRDRRERALTGDE
ncbi:MAG: cation diffusion facilitator family transporter [Haloferacaceae archaeon]